MKPTGTFANWFAENGVGVRYEHQANVVVIKYILRTFEAVVSADVILHFLRTDSTEHAKQENVEHLSTAIVILREMCFSHRLCRSIQLPVDRLERAEDQTQHSEGYRGHSVLEQKQIFQRPECMEETLQISQLLLHCSHTVLVPE